MKTSIMIDCETLSTKPSATILTVGAVKFDPYSDASPHSGFYHRIDVDEQIANGRDVDESTVHWWSQQPTAIREEAFGESDRISVVNFLAELNRYVVGSDKIYAQGTVFDICILENLYRMYNTPCPWNYYNIMDSRTLFSLTEDTRENSKDELHNALADAYIQAQAVQLVLKKFDLRKIREYRNHAHSN